MKYQNKLDRYVRGEHNVICDICGRKFKSSYTRKTWDNLIVCLDDWEPKPWALIPIMPIIGEGKAVRDARTDVLDSIAASVFYSVDKLFYPVQLYTLPVEQYDGTTDRLF